MTTTPKYSCQTETEKPKIILVHEPGLETKLAVENPDFWGFDPSLAEDPRSTEQWIEDARKEHQEMVGALESEGIKVLHMKDLLAQNTSGIIGYLEKEFSRILPRIGIISPELQRDIRAAYEEMLASPLKGVLLGLESGKMFSQRPAPEKEAVYRTLGTLMPQTSLLYTQDPVISSPAGLVKAKMSMFIRRQEPDVMELALGTDNYVHKLRNRTEGGDVTMFSCHGGDFLRIRGKMLVGISSLSGQGIDTELKRLEEIGGITELVRVYAPDYFDSSTLYDTENVMHLDTLKMPTDDNEFLGNRHMLEHTVVREGTKPFVNDVEWMRLNDAKLIEVPDDEQQGVFGWGSNIFPLGNHKILSSIHLKGTNKNLKEAGYVVWEIESRTLTSGFGSHHCMTAYLL